MKLNKSESILASYVTYKELYSNDSYKNPYQILAEFILFVIETNKLYLFSAYEMKKKLNDDFGFNLPDAVIKSALKKMEAIKKIPNSENYSINRDIAHAGQQFIEYKKSAEKDSANLSELLLDYAEKYYCSKPFNKNELIQEFVAYILNESNGNKYQEVISRFILDYSEDEKIVEDLNSIREGAILYLGLNCDISETGNLSDDLTLFLDMEILFDIYGYNGEVYQNLAQDMISLVRSSNRKIKLKYFECTKIKINKFFSAAEDVVKYHRFTKENVAMKAITDGCVNVTDVNTREADFFHDLKYGYGIILDEKTDYYSEKEYEYNLEKRVDESDKTLSDEEKEAEAEALMYLSNINKLRKDEKIYDYSKSKYIFVSQTWKTLDMARKHAEEISDRPENNGQNVCKLAVDMSFITNYLWMKLNRGFGGNSYPYNLDSVIKAKIVLSNFISQNVSSSFDFIKNEFSEGKLSVEQVAGRLLVLKEKAIKPEDISVDNISDNLDFSTEYLCKFETEREMQSVKLKEKEDIIQQLKNEKEVDKQRVQEEFNEINMKLSEAEKESSIQNEINKKNQQIIEEQNQIINEKDRLIEEYQRKEKQSQKVKEQGIKIAKFILGIVAWLIFLAIITVGLFFFLNIFFEDLGTIISIIIGILGLVGLVIGSIKKWQDKIWEKK